MPPQAPIKRAVGQVAQPPDHAAGDAVGQQGSGELARFGVEDQDERFVHGTQRIGGFVQAAGGDGGPAAGEIARPRTPPKSTCWPAVIGVKGLGVEAADRLTGSRVPFLDHTQKVAAQEALPSG